MNKNIKIIDAFNKIHNGEIKEKDILTSKRYLATIMEYYSIKDFLNCAVEILEDNTEGIEEIPNALINTEDPIVHLIEQHKKINELVKEVNSINKKIK